MRFSKWHGLGNDYLVVERAEAGAPLRPILVRRLCDRHRGIGADGILEIVSAERRRAEIVIWNPDGSTAELSGNGTRIAARWLARRESVESVTVAVDGLTVNARMGEGLEVEQAMGVALVEPEETIEIEGAPVVFTPVSLGNPHAVVLRDPERATILALGPLVERHRRFPQRTNVQFVRVVGRHELTVGVWERGAGETLSSGTSACAAAAAAIANGWCESPVLVRLPGGDLRVEIDESWRVLLTGSAEEICSGDVSAELLAALRPQTATP